MSGWVVEPGEKVHYAPDHGEIENGVVKTINSYGTVFVVYNCNGEWDRINEYTACATDPQDLRQGWSSSARSATENKPDPQ